MKQIFFVTGTDTDCGKTFVACKLLHAANRAGKKTLGLKPLASGAALVGGELRNSDALLLQQASTVSLPYAQTNPFCFADAIAPHLAAAKTGFLLSATGIANRVQAILDSTDVDYAIIEGAGGWRTPLNETETLADVVRLLQIPVILVVNMKLGCLNHALLTAEAIRHDGLQLHGWLANDMAGNSKSAAMPMLQENIATLEQMLESPRLEC
ncbi:MAG TPA: dethiobiotin synthase [Pseudomonadales bacterium]|nr:dethiobiotin synthase [Pseudomonadales bacterium]